MDNYINDQDDKESRLLVQCLLSTVEENKATNDDYEGIVDETVIDSQEVFDWDNLSDAEEEEDISTISTIDVPSYSETAQHDEKAEMAKATFLKELPVGKEFVDKDSARVFIQRIGEECNTPFETDKSDREYIKLVCKHYGNYRSARKNEGNKVKTI